MKTLFVKHDHHKASQVREGFLLLFMAFVTLGVYYPAILGPFSLFDDLGMTNDFLNNPTWSEVKVQIFKGGIYFRPLPIAAFYGIYAIFGLSPEPFHLFNVLIHLGSGLLIYFIIRRMYPNLPSTIWLAFTGAMIFLLHPLNVEAVAWISGRTSVMNAFFVLLTFFLHLNVQNGFRDWHMWTAALCYLLSLLSYEVALAMPLLFVYWDIGQDKHNSWRQSLKTHYHRWLPYGVVLAGYLVFRLVWRFANQTYTAKTTIGLKLFGLFEAFLDHFSSPFVAIGFYLKKVFWPWPLSFHIAEISPVARPFYLILGVVFLLTLAWWVWKRKWLGFWGLWFFGGLLAVLPLSFYSHSWTAAAERYVYLSSVGFAATVSILVFRFLGQQPRWVGRTSQMLVVPLLFTFGIGATLRAKTWQSNLTLVEDTWRKNPNSGQVADGYARVLMREGRNEEAISYWKKAIDLGRISEPAYFLGNVERAKKNYAAAEKYYLQSLWPVKGIGRKGSQSVTEMNIFSKRYPDAYLGLIALHWEMAEEEPDRADYHHERIIHFHQAASRVDPDDVYLVYLMAKAFLRLGKLEEAREHFAKVKDLAPDTYYGKAAGKLMNVKNVSYQAGKSEQ